MKVELKTKKTLRKKGESVGFTFSEALKVRFFWTVETDFDLCLFYKNKNGETGGVFSEGYSGKKESMGSLEKFPFIQLLADEDKPQGGNEVYEQLNISNLDEIDEAYIVVINYDAAKEDKENVTFAEMGGRVELLSSDGDYLEVVADSSETGLVYCVCYIKNIEERNTLTKCGGDDMHPEVMDLETAYVKIPGFSEICDLSLGKSN